jgi:hypothetical protein
MQPPHEMKQTKRTVPGDLNEFVVDLWWNLTGTDHGTIAAPEKDSPPCAEKS